MGRCWASLFINGGDEHYSLFLVNKIGLPAADYICHRIGSSIID